ncbi:response regulator transcription factor [Acidaminococcus sp. NSJ-142]|uniref:response regulator transcription factor n=1 Tax=Acidaminococcus TaxID=904 RepID=UPI000E4923AE|nr:response regulator transcription factor [Acidaminococcus sp. AM05-11]MCD2435483.1 response regulator transcription factor [Acidaminococcus hominis]RHK03451.1 DNA-binding response regulator [Acidaminococcus sp. AM05-11]
MSKILLAEDEKAMSMAVQAILTHQGHEVDLAANGQEAVDKASKNLYDCMVFDIMMPVKDGITALEEIRATGDTTPVIMLTAKAEVDDKILGLDAGADDYLTKPFAMGELLARIRSLTRRQSEFNPEKLTAGSVTLNCGEGELSSRSAVRLSPKETQLMRYLMVHAGKPCPTQQLLEHVWQEEKQEDPGIVWIYISYLREKLKAIGGNLKIDGSQGGSFTLKPVSQAS